MRYIIFTGSTMYCGTDYEQGEIYPDSVTDEQIYQDSREIAHDNAEMYLYLHDMPDPDDYKTEDEYMEAYDDEAVPFYFDACQRASWDEVTREEYYEAAEKNDWNDYTKPEDYNG